MLVPHGLDHHKLRKELRSFGRPLDKPFGVLKPPDDDSGGREDHPIEAHIYVTKDKSVTSLNDKGVLVKDTLTNYQRIEFTYFPKEKLFEVTLGSPAACKALQDFCCSHLYVPFDFVTPSVDLLKVAQHMAKDKTLRITSVVCSKYPWSDEVAGVYVPKFKLLAEALEFIEKYEALVTQLAMKWSSSMKINLRLTTDGSAAYSGKDVDCYGRDKVRELLRLVKEAPKENEDPDESE
jgi:hypothetical protein